MIRLLAESTSTFHEFIMRPSFWPSEANFLTWCQHMDPASAALLIVCGLVCLAAGFKMHRPLVGVTCGIIGAYLGAGLGERLYSMWIGLIAGGLLFGLIGWFFTSWMAAGCGAACGALLGASIWNMAEINAPAWTGALVGAILLGLLCFIIFRVSVIIFTSLQGAVMLVLGGLGMAYHYASLRGPLNDTLYGKPLVLPMALVVLAVLGMMYQYMKGPAGGGGKSSGGSSSSKPAKAPAKAEA